MSVNLILDTYISFLNHTRNLWKKQVGRRLTLCPFNICCTVSRSQPLRFFRTHKPLCSWTSSRPFCGTKHSDLQHKISLYCNISKLSTSSKGISKVSSRMSRIKSTLDSVSKAVSVTHNELIARIGRAKANSGTLKKVLTANVQINKKTTTDTIVTSTTAQKDSNKSLAVITLPETNGKQGPYSNGSYSPHPASTSNGASLNDSFFHISYFTTNFGETYNFLATHINYYFGADITMTQAKKGNVLLEKGGDRNQTIPPDCSTVNSENEQDSLSTLAPALDSTDVDTGAAAPVVSTKKGISHFLSNSSDSVQAFVDSYLGGLVPKLRSEAKSSMEDQSKEQESAAVGNKGEPNNDKESKSSEDKAKRLSLQREKIIARVSVDNRTRGLVQALRRASDRRVCINRVEELNCHLLEFPETRGVAVKEKAIPCLLRLRQTNEDTLQAAVREALALIGYIDPVKGRGIRVLTIDGGGTRGLVALQTLRRLEELTGKPIHQLFDYICGVSTGSILAFMVGLFHIPLDECEELYRKLGTDVFKQNVIVGTVKMGWSHAFYDSEIWEKILKERMGSDMLIETARNCNCPKDKEFDHVSMKIPS